MIVRPRPRWLRRIISPDRWVTVWPVVYHPEAVRPEYWPEVLAHEAKHLEQQGGRLRFWLWWLPR